MWIGGMRAYIDNHNNSTQVKPIKRKGTENEEVYGNAGSPSF